MKKIFYLLTMFAAMFAITSCDTKGNSTTPTSPDDDPKSGIEGTWVAIDTFYYNDSQWKQIVGRDVAMCDKETGYNAVYIFRKGKMSALAYNGIIDGDDFIYYKGDNTFIPSGAGVAVDYWLENGVLYSSLAPEGHRITYFDDKHMQIEDGYLLRKVNNLTLASQQSPFSNTYWATCDVGGTLRGMYDVDYWVYRFDENNICKVWGVYNESYNNGVFTLNENEESRIPNGLNYGAYLYIYAPNNKEIYLGYYYSKPIKRVVFSSYAFPLQILQENGETYLVDAISYKYLGTIMRKYKKVEVELVSE